MQGGLKLGFVVFAVGDSLHEGEHFVGGLGADECRHRVLAYGETGAEFSESIEDVGSGFSGTVGVLFF